MEQWKINHAEVLMCFWMLRNKKEAIQHCIEFVEKEIKKTKKDDDDYDTIFETYLRKLKRNKEIEENKKLA